jgi:hypothetical protein
MFSERFLYYESLCYKANYEKFVVNYEKFVVNYEKFVVNYEKFVVNYEKFVVNYEKFVVLCILAAAFPWKICFFGLKRFFMWKLDKFLKYVFIIKYNNIDFNYEKFVVEFFEFVDVFIYKKQ